MAEVDTERLYREMLAFSERLSRVNYLIAGNRALLRATNEELRRGRARIEASKKRFGFVSESTHRQVLP